MDYGHSNDDSDGIVEGQPVTYRQRNNRRLAQAINYIYAEGGEDPPEVYINRVDAIDEALLQPLSQPGQLYDAYLYRRARDMVREVQLDFEEAAQEPSSPSLESLGSAMVESEDEPPGFQTPSAVKSLYRKGDEINEPMKDHHDSVPPTEKEVETERKFKYGGPDNDPEQWARNFPAALPFPETIQMAHWESLKIDFDLSESNKKLKADGKIVETIVPFDHPELEQYKHLSQYDSGSRFKLPVPSKHIQGNVAAQNSSNRLYKVVNNFSTGANLNEQMKNEYTPRLFLEGITLGSQDLSEIRHAVNTTPTKPRTSVARRSSVATSSTRPTQSTTAPIDHRQTPSRQRETAQAKEKARLARERTDALLEKARAAREAARLATEKSILANRKSLDAAEKQRKIQEAATLLSTSPVARKLSRTRHQAIEASPRRQSGTSTAPTTPKSPKKPPTPFKTTTRSSPQVVVPPAKRPRGRPRNTPVTSSAAAPTTVTTTPAKTPGRPKRKRSLGDKPYTPEPTPKRTKQTHLATPATMATKKIVHFTPGEDSSSDNEPKSVSRPKTVNKTPLPTPSSKKNVGTQSAAKATKTPSKITKATAAGQAERSKEERKKKLTGETVQPGSTRGGKEYLKR